MIQGIALSDGGMSMWVKWLPRAGGLTLAGACARLAFLLFLFALLVAPFSFQRVGWPGVWAAAAAAGVCGVGGALALAVAAWSRRVPAEQRALWVMLGGMVFRMFLPLGAGLALDRLPALKGTGVFGLVVVFYLLTLIAETWLSFALLGSSGGLTSVAASGGGSSANGALGSVEQSRGGL